MNAAAVLSDVEVSALLAACGLYCGTPAGYQRHIRARTTTCDACKAAKADYRRSRLNTPKRTFRPHVPGTSAGYRRHVYLGQPPCGRCADAYRAYQRARHAANTLTARPGKEPR